MFEMLKELYLNGKITSRGLSNAVIAKYITESQKQEILALK